MSRRACTIIAVALLLLGLPAFVAGAVLLVTFGPGGRLSSGSHAVSTPTRALVSSVAHFEGIPRTSAFPGGTRIHVSALPRDAGHGVFIGVARAADVDRYLAGADIDIIDDLGVVPFTVRTQRREGFSVPPTPSSQTFWVASAEARTGPADLSWAVDDGTYRVVLMNSDAAAGVDVDADLGVAMPQAFGVGVLVMGIALALALAGGVILVVVAVHGSVAPSAPSAPGTRMPPPGLTPAASAAPPMADPAQAPRDSDQVRSTHP